VSALDLIPRPGRAPYGRMILAHARFELGQLLGNGEQLLLTLVIPTVLLILLTEVDVVDLGPGPRVRFLLPGVLALAVMSTAFTSLAIATGFERRYGVLKRLGATPLPRAGLLAGKGASALACEVLQVVLLVGVALVLGWRPVGAASWAATTGLLLLGTAAFAGLGLLMAGTLRAEATLAAANLVYLLLLLAGGIVVPVSRFPSGARGTLGWLPSTALADGLRAAFAGAAVPARCVVVLLVWGLVSGLAAARWFRWE
jgi:ABC-2 type transport system permease protein